MPFKMSMHVKRLLSLSRSLAFSESRCFKIYIPDLKGNSYVSLIWFRQECAPMLSKPFKTLIADICYFQLFPNYCRFTI